MFAARADRRPHGNASCPQYRFHNHNYSVISFTSRFCGFGNFKSDANNMRPSFRGGAPFLADARTVRLMTMD